MRSAKQRHRSTVHFTTTPNVYPSGTTEVIGEDGKTYLYWVGVYNADYRGHKYAYEIKPARWTKGPSRQGVADSDTELNEKINSFLDEAAPKVVRKKR